MRRDRSAIGILERDDATEPRPVAGAEGVARLATALRHVMSPRLSAIATACVTVFARKVYRTFFACSRTVSYSTPRPSAACRWVIPVGETAEHVGFALRRRHAPTRSHVAADLALWNQLKSHRAPETSSRTSPVAARARRRAARAGVRPGTRDTGAVRSRERRRSSPGADVRVCSRPRRDAAAQSPLPAPCAPRAASRSTSRQAARSGGCGPISAPRSAGGEP
jgi:hypothetical protein